MIYRSAVRTAENGGGFTEAYRGFRVICSWRSEKGRGFRSIYIVGIRGDGSQETAVDMSVMEIYVDRGRGIIYRECVWVFNGGPSV